MRIWLAAALATQAQWAAAVTISVEAPRGAQIETRLRRSDELVGAILTPEALRTQQEGRNNASTIFLYKASGWREGVALELRETLLARLKALWEGRVSVLDDADASQAADSKPRDPQSSFDASAVQGQVGALAPQSLLSGQFGLFYDGSAASNGPSVAATAGPWKPSGATLPDVNLFSSARSLPVTVPAVERDMSPPDPVLKAMARRYGISEERMRGIEAEVQRAARKHGLDPDELRTVIAVKSGFDSNNDSGDAHGLMGLSRGTFRALGGKPEDILDPRANIDAGARILARLLRQFDGDLHRALAAYQVGPRAVIKSGGIPNDRQVKDLLAAYELAYRGEARKPAVKQVEPPARPNLRRAKEEIVQVSREAVVGTITHPRVARYRPMIERAADRAGVDSRLLEAMIIQESGGKPDAVSKQGALGLAQIMPGTAKALGIDPRDPAQAISGMSRHFDHLVDLFDGDVVLAVAAYHAGEGNIKKVHGRIPASWPRTRHYVRVVFENYYELTGRRVEVEPYLQPARKRSAPTLASAR